MKTIFVIILFLFSAMLFYFLFLKFIYRPVKAGYHVEEDRVVFYQSTGLFSKDRLQTNLDPRQYKELGHFHAKDNDSAYFKGKRIEGANAESFELIFDNFSRDGIHVYWNERSLTDINPTNTKKVITKFGTYVTDGVTIYGPKGEKVDSIPN